MLQEFSPSADVCPPPPPASVPPGMFPPQSSTAGINPFSRKAGGSRDQLHNIGSVSVLVTYHYFNNRFQHKHVVSFHILMVCSEVSECLS